MRAATGKVGLSEIFDLSTGKVTNGCFDLLKAAVYAASLPLLLGSSSIEQERHRIPRGYAFGRGRRTERGEPFQKGKYIENIWFLQRN